MRFKITFHIDRRYGDCLPINYQYEQSALIYRVLSNANKSYADWLHDNGFQFENGKHFKLFCYSRFRFERFKIIPDAQCIKILGDSIKWTVSFLPEQSTAEFVHGLFANQLLLIGNKDYKVAMEVIGIEAIPAVDFKETMVFSADSSVCIRDHQDGRTQYLSPLDSRYKQALLNGILSRFETFHGKPFEGDTASFDFKLLTDQPKSSLITIKANTPNQTRVRGYRYDFSLTAPTELMKIAYEGGLGELCSQGFGFIEIKKYDKRNN
jgi:CRISPR-associated endoribonuclease Cas6